MNNLTALFLSQSYKDTWEDYCRALNSDSFPRWDAVIITASNEQQAKGYELQLAERTLPENTHFAVIPDKDGKRVGSGGATLSVIKYLKEKFGTFENKRFLVIHSGGDSKRVPSNSALGKLFSPVPHLLPNGCLSTLFDEFMISMSSIPGRINEGMLILSGDVLLLFNPLQIDNFGSGAAAISFKESVHTGKNHGVFLLGEDGNVKRFLHKQSEEKLLEAGAINEKNNVDIDTGAVFFGRDLLSALFSLVSNKELEEKYINDTVRLSLYGDFLYPLATDSTIDDYYLETPEGEFCDELHEARTKIWNLLKDFRLRLFRLSPAKFVHFGTTNEVLELMNEKVKDYSLLGWSDSVGSVVSVDVPAYNSILDNTSKVGKGTYLETSYVHSNSVIGNNCFLSFVDITEKVIPDNTVLHGLKQMNGNFVCRIYGVKDNPKNNFLFGISIDDFIEKNNISENEIWGNGDSHTLWTAKLYPECRTIDDAVTESLKLYDLLVSGKGNIDDWIRSERKSLCSGFNNADSEAIIRWSRKLQELVVMENLSENIREGVSVEQIKTDGWFRKNELSDNQKEWLERKISENDFEKPDNFSHIIRLYYYLGELLSDEYYKKLCYKTISEAILNSSLNEIKFNDKLKITEDEVVVNMPLRVNFGGGWSDTAPHCLEKGGTVLNASIKVNGKYPVEVRIIKTEEKKIVFDSRDMNVHGEFDDISLIQDTGNPFDAFALQKACLIACGVIPSKGGRLSDILDRLGGGFEMHSEVTGIPKGSGLGTSSILSAACAKATLDFCGITYSDDKLFSVVIAMEQIMSTGGGWQDQVGGVCKGIKYITSNPGIKQKPIINSVDISETVRNELNERFCLIYTGQRRLARNLLRNVIGRYIGNNPESISAHKEIRRIATLMRYELEKGDIDSFAELMDEHWRLSKQIDEGCTNTLIEHIFFSIRDLICGRLVCGAGGGGFVQVILRKGITKQDVRTRLKDTFQDFGVDVWDVEFE